MDDAPVHGAASGVDRLLVAYEQQGVLLGLRCPRCGYLAATWGIACSRCGGLGLEEVRLGSAGRLVAFTLVEVPTEERVNDAPYAYVLVELDGGGTIAGWMPSVRSSDELKVGDRVRLSRSYRTGVQFEPEPPSGSPRG